MFDLDPQSTASQVLLSESNFLSRCRTNKNLYGLVSSILKSRNPRDSKYWQGMAHHIKGKGHVDLRLFPNSDRFWTLEEREIKGDGGKGLAKAISGELRREAEEKRLVIVDCPPGQSISALAAIRSSDMVLCPITPDRFALWGTKLLDKYIKANAPGILPTFIITRASFTGTAAREFFREIQQYDDINILRIDTGQKTPATTGDIAYMSEKSSVKKRIGLSHDKTLVQIYGKDVAQQMKNVSNAVMRVLEDNG